LHAGFLEVARQVAYKQTDITLACILNIIMPTKTEPLSRPSVAIEVNKSLHSYTKQKIVKARLQDESYERLWLTIDTYLQRGGKRIRPYLVLLAYEAYGGRHSKDVLPIAAAWELLHACLLVHDDIIDRDTVRHGALNISGMYEVYYKKFGSDRSHYAASAALLAGDLLLSGAHELVLESAIAAEEKLRACTYLNEALFSVGGGELLDVEIVLQDIKSARPEKIARHKTAQYSFEYPLLCGATLAGVSIHEKKKLQSFGTSIGIAFQLIDDVLGVFGDTASTGKSNDNDIRDKKRTLLVQETLKRLDDQEATHMEALYAHNYVLTSDEAQNVRTFMEQTGAREAVEKIAKGLADDALRIVDTMSIGDGSREALRGVVSMAVKRIS
jgi:geranylgeranyl diphosphate synthase, type II